MTNDFLNSVEGLLIVGIFIIFFVVVLPVLIELPDIIISKLKEGRKKEIIMQSVNTGKKIVALEGGPFDGATKIVKDRSAVLALNTSVFNNKGKNVFYRRSGRKTKDGSKEIWVFVKDSEN